MPDISPDFGAPGVSGLTTIASWVLALCMIVAFIALILAIVAMATKGFGNQQIQSFAAKAIGWVALAVACLGSISAIFQFVVGFDLGI